MIELQFSRSLGARTAYFDIVEDGEELGEVEVRTRPENTLIINIYTSEGPGSLGPRKVKELLKQLREHYPEAKRITGHRVKAGVSSRLAELDL